MDVEMQIIDTLSTIHTTISKFEHVRGHQDTEDIHHNNSLPRLVQLNIICNQIATSKLKTLTTLQHVPHLPASQVSLTVHFQSLTHHISSQIRKIWSRKHQMRYYTKHHEWTEGAHNNIDWELFSSTIQTKKLTKQWWFSKWINHILPFHSRQEKMRLTTTDKCPSLCNCIENEQHFLQCPHHQRTSLLQTLHPTLNKIFKQHHIDPKLRRATLALTTTTQVIQNPPFTSIYTEILHEQRKLGIDSLFYGFFHTLWIEKQTAYLKIMKLPNNK